MVDSWGGSIYIYIYICIYIYIHVCVYIFVFCSEEVLLYFGYLSHRCGAKTGITKGMSLVLLEGHARPAKTWWYKLYGHLSPPRVSSYWACSFGCLKETSKSVQVLMSGM